jgi:hypothetical protein
MNTINIDSLSELPYAQYMAYSGTLEHAFELWKAKYKTEPSHVYRYEAMNMTFVYVAEVDERVYLQERT